MFSFTDNKINLSDAESHLFFCKSGIKIKDENCWRFSNNAIDPPEDSAIKTQNVDQIPAECQKGFLCGVALSSEEIESPSELVDSPSVESAELSH